MSQMGPSSLSLADFNEIEDTKVTDAVRGGPLLLNC